VGIVGVNNVRRQFFNKFGKPESAKKRGFAGKTESLSIFSMIFKEFAVRIADKKRSKILFQQSLMQQKGLPLSAPPLFAEINMRYFH
jgi:hypothetical protein